jgi:hypothetical protein
VQAAVAMDFVKNRIFERDDRQDRMARRMQESLDFLRA